MTYCEASPERWFQWRRAFCRHCGRPIIRRSLWWRHDWVAIHRYRYEEAR